MTDTITRTCWWCNEQFETFTTTARYCCRYHKERAKEARRISHLPVYTGTCPHCDQAFTTRIKHQKYCSPQCKWTARRMQREEREKQLSTQAKGFRQKLYFRDEGVCGICREPILLTHKYPDPQSLSIDHVVPLARGGLHTQANLQIAHWICNVNKADKTLGNHD